MTWRTVMAMGVCMSELLKLPTFGKCGSLFINHISIKLFVKRLAGKPVTPQEGKDERWDKIITEDDKDGNEAHS